MRGTWRSANGTNDLLRRHRVTRGSHELNREQQVHHSPNIGEVSTKTIIATAAAALFAANVSAVEIYHGFADGNEDLSPQRVGAEDFVGVQPSVGDSVSRYHGWDEGNSDLFKGDGRQSRTSTGRPDIYSGFSGNPDLRF